MTTGRGDDPRDVEGDAVRAVLDAHVPDAGGFCAGCLEQWDRLVPHSGCTQVAWARPGLG
jgi:hypothetical protein